MDRGWHSLRGPLPKAEASMLIPLTIEQMSRMADSIVYVRTASTQARKGAVDSITGTLRNIETAIHLTVLTTLKGGPVTQKDIVLLGGTVGTLTLSVDTVPVFRPGETCILFRDRQGRVIGEPRAGSPGSPWTAGLRRPWICTTPAPCTSRGSGLPAC